MVRGDVLASSEPQPEGGHAMKRLISTATLIVALALPAVALASGQLAPRQAYSDAAAVCEGPIEGELFVAPSDRGTTIAVGYCRDRYAGRVVVGWLMDGGQRFVYRVGIDTSWTPVPSYAPVLDCIRVLDGRELCK